MCIFCVVLWQESTWPSLTKNIILLSWQTSSSQLVNDHRRQTKKSCSLRPCVYFQRFLVRLPKSLSFLKAKIAYSSLETCHMCCCGRKMPLTQLDVLCGVVHLTCPSQLLSVCFKKVLDSIREQESLWITQLITSFLLCEINHRSLHKS